MSSTLSKNVELSQSRKQTLLAILVAIFISLAWYNSVLFRGKKAAHRTKQVSSVRARTQPLQEETKLPEYVKVLREGARIDTTQANQFALSHDTDWIAYFSNGELWCQRVPDGPSVKLDDRRTKKLGVASLHWDMDAKQVFYAMALPSDEHAYPTIETFVASCEQRCSRLTTLRVKRSDWRSRHQYRLTEDGRYVVGFGLNPLIWDISTEQLIVCPFSQLIPSPTSERWLGVEIDTNQLVVTNGNFEIEKRVEFFVPRYDLQLRWSPNERYACLFPLERRGGVRQVRIDLETGTVQSIEPTSLGRRAPEFTGNGGELFHVGFSKQKKSSILETRPTEGTSRFNYITGFPNLLHILPGADSRYAAIANAIPHRGGPVYRVATDQWHVVDETGQAWTLGELDDSLASFAVLGFSNNGTNLIACDLERIVAIPVAPFDQVERD